MNDVKTTVGWCEIRGDKLDVGPTEPFDPLDVLDWTSRAFAGAVEAVGYLAGKANQCCIQQGKSEHALFAVAFDNAVHVSILSTVCSDWSPLEGQHIWILQLSPSMRPCAEQKGPRRMHSGEPFSRLALMALGAATGACACAVRFAAENNCPVPLSPIVCVVGAGQKRIVSCHAAVRPPQMTVGEWIAFTEGCRAMDVERWGGAARWSCD